MTDDLSHDAVHSQLAEAGADWRNDLPTPEPDDLLGTVHRRAAAEGDPGPRQRTRRRRAALISLAAAAVVALVASVAVADHSHPRSTSESRATTIATPGQQRSQGYVPMGPTGCPAPQFDAFVDGKPLMEVIDPAAGSLVVDRGAPLDLTLHLEPAQGTWTTSPYTIAVAPAVFGMSNDLVLANSVLTRHLAPDPSGTTVLKLTWQRAGGSPLAAGKYAVVILASFRQTDPPPSCAVPVGTSLLFEVSLP